MRKELLAIALLLATFSLHAQDSITIRGWVTNTLMEPVENASVVIKGSRSGTITDTEGSFRLRVKLPATLIVSAVGFDPAEHRVEKKDSSRKLSILLKNRATVLNEVVVTGYGSSARKEMYAAPPSISSKSLSGRVAGVSIEKGKAVSEALSADADGMVSRVGAARAGTLTAGEVNDFKKWKLWSDYSKNDFSTWSAHWDLYLRNRYCVQVQNNERRALVGEKVYLVRYATQDTVWSAVTDNTGKAELWDGSSGTRPNGDHYLIICGGEKVYEPVVFEKGISRITLNRDCAAPELVDIAFVVDATGSMSDEISYLQTELQDIIAVTAEKHKDIQLRLGSVFYRDHSDAYLTRNFDFQTDPDALQEFIGAQSAEGGGDRPEAVDDALQAALGELHWSARARAHLLFLILDAPPRDTARNKMKELIRKAAAMGVRIIPIACSGVDKSTEYLMRSIALATNGSYVFLTDDSGVGEAHIKPTTDEFKVELLNELMERLIGEMIYVPSCKGNEPVVVAADTTVAVVKMTVYPNPTRDRITIETSKPVKELWITDFAGKVLLRLSTNDRKDRFTADLGNYPAGTYLVKYFVEDKGWFVQKVVVIH